jgi:hypothetical protein
VESIPHGKIHITRQRKEQTPVNCSYGIITTAEWQINVGQDGGMWRNYVGTPPASLQQQSGRLMLNKMVACGETTWTHLRHHYNSRVAD